MPAIQKGSTNFLNWCEGQIKFGITCVKLEKKSRRKEESLMFSSKLLRHRLDYKCHGDIAVGHANKDT